MITRILIRIKVVQMLYSYFLTSNERTVADAKKELAKSLEKAYELYISLLVLMIELTDLQEQKLDQAKNKFLPTNEDLNPNTRFVENELVKNIRSNEQLHDYLQENPISWRTTDDIFMKLMLDKIVNSDIYEEYMNAEVMDYEGDCEFWKNVFKKILLVDEDLIDNLESKSVYWNDDLNVMGTFVLKTIKQFATNVNSEIQPMYKDEEDSQYAERLFTLAVREREENDKLIDQFIQKESWDAERIAFMDRIVLGAALSEIKNFNNIPTKVSLNEYIEIAKYYSTPKSGQFVNGVLHSAITYLKKQGRIIKD